jgi:hypothetical protein
MRRLHEARPVRWRTRVALRAVDREGEMWTEKAMLHSTRPPANGAGARVHARKTA